MGEKKPKEIKEEVYEANISQSEIKVMAKTKPRMLLLLPKALSRMKKSILTQRKNPNPKKMLKNPKNILPNYFLDVGDSNKTLWVKQWKNPKPLHALLYKGSLGNARSLPQAPPTTRWTQATVASRK